jgi:phosphoadenosine phosphosulfate reductase
MNKQDFSEKSCTSKTIVEEALGKCRSPYVAFSGGKDSTAMLHLVRSVNPDIPAVFHNTGVEAPETLEYVRTIPNLIETRPDGYNFWDIVKKYGYPELKSKNHDGNKCCVYLKEKPAQKIVKEKGFDLVFLGITIHESRNRWMMLKRMGHTYQAKKDMMWKCYPIWNWTEKEVWQFIRGNNLAYNKGYDCGWKRCGCMPCTAHYKWQFRLASENPKMLRYIMRSRYGQRQCGDYMGEEKGLT